MTAKLFMDSFTPGATKIQKHIEIVSSTNSLLSSMGKESREAVLALLSQHYTKVGITIVNNLIDLQWLVSMRPDLVFMGMKFVSSDSKLGLQDPSKIWIADFLDGHGIAYTGSNHLAHELELNKDLAKQRILDAGLQTSPFYVARQHQFNAHETKLKFPVFIKPTNRGGGTGIDSASIARNEVQLQAKVQSIANELQSDSLIEEYLPGREFSVAILKQEHSGEFLVLPIEKVAPKDKDGERMLSRHVKSSDVAVDLKITDKVTRAGVSAIAIKVFHALGARDYGRIDIRFDKVGTPHFLEANLIPSILNGYGSFPKACEMNAGMNYETMILSIVRLGLARNTAATHQEVEPVLDALFNHIATPELA